MAMSKITSFSAVLFLLLLLLSTQSSAARREPSGSAEGVEVAETNKEVVGGSCEGAADIDACLMRRTLAAHTDYIYTQKQKP